MKEDYDIYYYCGTHGKYLDLAAGKYGVYKRCPFYEREKRPAGMPSCPNRLSVMDDELIRQRIDKAVKEGKDLLSYRERYLHLEFYIKQIEEDDLHILVVNHRKYQT